MAASAAAAAAATAAPSSATSVCSASACSASSTQSQTSNQPLSVALGHVSNSSSDPCSVSFASIPSSSSCYLARKRPRRMAIYGTGIDTTVTSAAHYLQYEMPDEVLLTIFSYLLEQDLCRLSLVCKRFNTIANDTELWKRLYQNVYEYDMPLFNPEPCKFHFVKPEDSEYANPWKESFRQLYRGVHVRPGYQNKRYKGRNISYFENVQSALDYADERSSASNNCSNNNSSSANASGSLVCGEYKF